MQERNKPLQETGDSSFFQQENEPQEAPSQQEEKWVVAEPCLIYPEMWVESKFGKGRRFDSMADCNRYIRLSPNIDNLVKVGLKAKRESELKS